MNSLLTVLLMAPKEGENPLISMLPLVLIVVVFYFFMIRDKVITLGGIYGKVVESSDKTVILEVEGKMRLKVDKSALVADSSDVMSPS